MARLGPHRGADPLCPGVDPERRVSRHHRVPDSLDRDASSGVSRLMPLRLLVVPALLAALVSSGCGDRRDRRPVYSGTIEAVEVDVVPEVTGRILERPVDQGDRVKAGDVVARVDPAPYANAVAETEAGLAEARAK